MMNDTTLASSSRPDLINRLLHAAESVTGRTGPLLQEAANEICSLKSRIEISGALPEAPAVPVGVVTEEMAERFSAGVDKYWKGRKSGRDGDAIMAGLRSALSTPPAPTAAVDGRLYDDTAPMADGEIEMTAAENVLAWLIIEKIGVPDDETYSPKEAQDILARAIDQLHGYEDAAALSPGTADIPDWEPVSWQHRYKHNNPNAIWSEWGEHQPALSSYPDWIEEDRPLYARPSPNDGEALLREAREQINRYADTAREHDLVARIDAALARSAKP